MDACIEIGAVGEASAYVSRIPEHDIKAECYIDLSDFRKAAQCTMLIKDADLRGDLTDKILSSECELFFCYCFVVANYLLWRFACCYQWLEVVMMKAKCARSLLQQSEQSHELPTGLTGCARDVMN